MSFTDPLPVVAVHHEDESLSVLQHRKDPRSVDHDENSYKVHLEVVSPERSDLVLATHVPDCEADVLVLHRLHVEPCEGE